jgi:phosphopantothenoylcysteine decarboxylase/phosphopantothenate--cysteine ligase
MSAAKRSRGFKNVLVTAGPTREKIDDVRFISNLSTGRMGFEIARAAVARGYKVTLISGPTGLTPPRGARYIPVEEAREMAKAVRANFRRADCLFMASAVSDWRPEHRIRGKIKKAGGKKAALRLVKNPDIVSEAGRIKRGRLVAGFALESKDIIKNAEAKLVAKNLDFIVANGLGRRTPFGGGRTDATIIDRYGAREAIHNAPKGLVARKVIEKAERLWRERV